MEPEDAQDKACEKYDCDPAMYDKYVEMKRDDRETKKVSEGGGRDMECGHCDGTGKHGDKDCKKCEGTGEAQDDDDPMNNESKVEETTSSGSVATSEAGGKPLFKNASVYESNEIVKRAKQLNEDMSISVNAGTNAEPSININASGEEAAKLAQLLKLAGMGMAQPGYGEVQVDVAEDQEFANGADDTNTMDTEYMTQDIAGGLNGPKKMAYPKVAGGDNPMSVLGESELNEVSEDHLMKLYQEYKAK
jgi:DnaJ-class molecular chaperone